MRRGFTLIEILAVVTILAIAAVAAIPMVSSGFADVKLAAAARAVMADLFYAQNYAITNQTDVYVVFATANGTGGRYTLQTGSNGTSGVKLVRPGDGTFVVNLGSVSGTLVGTRLPDAKLGTVTADGAAPTANAIGFDTLGQPFNGTSATPISGNVDAPANLGGRIPLLSPDGKMTMTLLIESFTGEIILK